MSVVMIIGGAVVAAHAAEAIAYRETAAVRRHVEDLVTRRRPPSAVHCALRRPRDLPFGVLALTRTWLEFFLLLLLIRSFGDSVMLCMALSVVVAGRFRALQEISHFAIHSALGSNSRTGLLLANVFFQFPLMRGAARHRRRAHVGVHHRQSNLPGKDPNLDDLRAAGIVPGCGITRLLAGAFFPVWPSKLLNGVRGALEMTFGGPRDEVLCRVVLVGGLLAATFMIGGWHGIFFGWLLPRLVLYPWLAWLSQLLEHTWYSPMPDERPGSREFHAGRATHYGWATRLLLRALVLPAGDSYHLAHSLFPTLRWNYLPLADRLLARHSARYARDASQGLLFKRAGQPRPTAFDWLVSIARRGGERTDALHTQGVERPCP